MTTTKENYKDANPEDTINRIKTICRTHSIPLSVEHEININNQLHSLGVHLEGFTYHVNGKGITREYAMASGYAEMMERLQNQILFMFTEFNPAVYDSNNFILDPFEKRYIHQNLPSLPAEFKNEKLITNSTDAYSVWETVKKECLTMDYPIVYLPYYNATKKTVENLPRPFIMNLLGTNGMCSGNTKEEALVQGISEIYERYVMKRLYFEEITPPSIPDSYLQEHAPKQYKIIQYLQDVKEYNVIVKDCRFDQNYPVIAVILIHRKELKYLVNIGAHPVWQDALERCLTEAFQGRDVDDYKDLKDIIVSPYFELKNNFDNYMNINICGKGCYPEALFYDTPDYKFHDFPPRKDFTQHDMLLKLMSAVEKSGYSIFVRDVSFLGFPAFHLIIPGMSATKMLSRKNWKETITKISIVHYFSFIEQLTKKELQLLITEIENFIFENIYAEFLPLSRILGIPVKDYSGWATIPLQFILAVLYFKTGRIKEAYQFIKIYAGQLDSEYEREEIKPILAARDYLSLAREYYTNQQKIRSVLLPIYGTEMTESILHIFSQGQSIVQIIQAFFPEFKLPNCWNCSSCEIKEYCQYDRLESIRINLRNAVKANPINQNSLNQFFEKIRNRRDV